MNDAGGRTAVAALWRKYRTKQPGLAIIRNGKILVVTAVVFVRERHQSPDCIKNVDDYAGAAAAGLSSAIYSRSASWSVYASG